MAVMTHGKHDTHTTLHKRKPQGKTDRRRLAPTTDEWKVLDEGADDDVGTRRSLVKEIHKVPNYVFIFYLK